jgi:2-methylcitrate dehydratase PrpD
MTDLTQALADHAAGFPAAGVTDAITDHLALDLADTLAAAIGGSRAEGVPQTLAFLAEESPRGPARVFASGLRLSALAAAQANATAAHALDYDNTLDEGGGMHAGAAVHSAALAVADSLGGVSGRDYASAVAVGLDVAVRLALAPTEDFGWHRTSAFGVFGVTVAVGRLLGLSRDQLADALGIAYAQASGNRQCIPDGALTKRLQSGFSARDGITAVRLAQAGLTGPANAFEGKDGFFNLYQRGAYDRRVVLDGLGETLLSDRISLKPYPCGRNLHAILDAALAARAQGASSAPVAAVRVKTAPAAAARANLAFPRHVVEAQFNIPFAVALAVTTGATPLAAFDQPAQVAPAVTDLFAKVAIEALDAATATGITAIVEITYADGQTARAEVGHARGHPTRPLDAAAIEAKFQDCNAFAGSPLTAQAVSAVVGEALGLATLSSTRRVTDLLARG